MDYPKCGSQTQSDQNFCRSCGASMQMITQPLTEHASLSDLERTPATIFKEERQRANRWVLSGVIIMFIGVAIGVIGKKLMHEEIVTVIGVLVFLAGMFFTVYPSLLPSTRPKSDSSASSQPEAPRQSRPAKYLPQGSGIEYVPSITERTTNLLKNSAATRPRKKEDGELQAKLIEPERK